MACPAVVVKVKSERKTGGPIGDIKSESARAKVEGRTKGGAETAKWALDENFEHEQNLTKGMEGLYQRNKKMRRIWLTQAPIIYLTTN